MSERWWVLLNEDGIIVGQVCHPVVPTADEACGTPFASAIEVSRRGDLATELANDGEWIPNLEELRSRRRAAINAERDARQDGGCTTPLGAMDTDARSRAFLNGAVTMALLAQQSGQPFEENWTMRDQTTVPHTAEQLIAAGIAVGAFISEIHAQALALKNEIDAALTADDIEAVAWPA